MMVLVDFFVDSGCHFDRLVTRSYGERCESLTILMAGWGDMFVGDRRRHSGRKLEKKEMTF
jgi:hypothetical protein